MAKYIPTFTAGTKVPLDENFVFRNVIVIRPQRRAVKNWFALLYIISLTNLNRIEKLRCKVGYETSKKPTAKRELENQFPLMPKCCISVIKSKY